MRCLNFRFKMKQVQRFSREMYSKLDIKSSSVFIIRTLYMLHRDCSYSEMQTRGNFCKLYIQITKPYWQSDYGFDFYLGLGTVFQE